MVAIAGRESGFHRTAANYRPPDHSIGLWMINQLAHRGRFGSDQKLMWRRPNARAARKLYLEVGLSPWWRPGGPLAHTDIAAARRAVIASRR
jgi:hypothetical protein